MTTRTVDYKEAGRRLSDLREAAALRPQQLADLAGINVKNVRYYERAGRDDGQSWQPAPEMTVRIAQALGKTRGTKLLEAYGLGHLTEDVFIDDGPALSSEQRAVVAEALEIIAESLGVAKIRVRNL